MLAMPGNNRVVQFLKPAAVVNAATFQASVPVAQGGLASLFGAGLAGDTSTVSATTWPTTAAEPASGRQRPICKRRFIT